MDRVTIFIMTCGRAAKQPWLMNETVYWAANQAYDNYEVLILNDAPGQVLVCDYPHVRIVNLPERISDLGTKCNIGVQLAEGDIVLPNDDDDVSLPGRAAQAVAMLDGYEYWTPWRWWFCMNGAMPVMDGNGTAHNCSAYRRLPMLGNHSPAIVDSDRKAIQYAREHLKCRDHTILDPASLTYCYRWGVSPIHLSGCPNPDEAYRRYDPGPAGTYRIVPAMPTDWVELTRLAASTRR